MEEMINRRICLEPFRSRYNGMLPSFSGNSYNNNHFTGKTISSYDYGEIPVDTVMQSGTTELGIKIKKLWDILPTIPCIKKDEEWVLRYRTMVRAYTFLDDFIRGRHNDEGDFVFNCRYYKLCKRDKDFEWIEITDDMWEDMLSDVDNDTIPLTYQKFFHKKSMPVLSELPYHCEYIYTIDDTRYIAHRNEDIPASVEDVTSCVKYELFKNISGNTNGITEDGAIICINKDALEYNKRFTPEYEWVKCYEDGYVEDSYELKKSVPMNAEHAYNVAIDEDGNFYKLMPKYNSVYAEDFLDFVDYVKNNKREDGVGGVISENKFVSVDGGQVHNSMPYIPIHFLIEQSIDDIGQLTPYIEDWVPNKPYYVGDQVYFNKKVYTLVYTGQTGFTVDKVEITYVMYKSLNEQELSDGVSVSTEVDSDGVRHYYYSRLYYKGYYDGTYRLTFIDEGYDFNEPSNDKGFIYWKFPKPEEEDLEDMESENYDVTIEVGSYIKHLWSFRKSYDDFGTQLPFNFVENGTSLTYKIGFSNIVTNDGYVFGDYLSAVTFIHEETEKSVVFNGSHKHTIDTNDVLTTIPWGSEGVKVMFEYIKGASIDITEDNASVKPNTGLICKEVFNATFKEYLCLASGEEDKFDRVMLIDVSEGENFDENDVSAECLTEANMTDFNIESNYGRICKFTGEDTENFIKNNLYLCVGVFRYIDIDYDNPIEVISNDDLYTLSNEMISKNEITYNTETMKTDVRPNTFGFKDDSLIGVQNMKEDIDVYIERGTSSALETHQILSEVNTFDDLENYRNDFFKLKGQTR